MQGSTHIRTKLGEQVTSLDGKNGQFSTSRGGYYDSEPHAIVLNPDLMKSAIYRGNIEMTVHFLIHEGDHAVRKADVAATDHVTSVAQAYILRDSLETSAQRRANEYFAEIGRPLQNYNDPLNERHDSTQRTLCKPGTASFDVDGSFTAKSGFGMVVGEGRLQQFEGDSRRLAEFLSGLGCGRVNPELIQRYLDRNPQAETQAPEAPRTPDRSEPNVSQQR